MLRDEVHLCDMLLAAREVMEHTREREYAECEADRLRHLAVIKLIENIGEAAQRLSPEYRQANPHLPWSRITGMRHHLVHGYDIIDLDRVWRVARIEIPTLVTALEKLLPPPYPK